MSQHRGSSRVEFQLGPRATGWCSARVRYTPGVDAHWVETDEALAMWCERLRDAERIAVDTESNSMYAYFERICLVQISLPGHDILIDPLAVDLAALGPVLADSRVQKVMHGADYDVLSFKRSLGFRIENLFDTMLAARVLGWPRCGLASLLSEHFDHDSNKAYQRYDWGRRPLSAEALEYARYDTHHLLALADLQHAQLQDTDWLELFERACVRQTAVEPRTKPFDPDGYWKFKGARELDEPGRSVLKALFAWRDAKAQELDRPPFRVMPEVAMIGAARDRPRDARGLGQVKGMPKPLVRRDADVLLTLIGQAEEQPCAKPARASRHAGGREVGLRMDALKAWRKAEAERRGVEPEIILDKASLMAVAEQGDVAVLNGWESDHYGASMQTALAEAAAK